MTENYHAESYLTEDTDPEIRLLEEDELERRMKDTVEPYLSSVAVSGRIQGGAIYYELFALEEARGTVVISHGYAEAGRKYHELIYYFLQHGFQAAVLDHRGHGRSVREGGDPDVAYVDRFDRYAEDLHLFVQEKVLPKLHREGCPLYLYGHSMGGCIAARYLELYPDDFDRAVLNAPMLGLKLGLCPSWAALLLCGLHVCIGRGESRLFYQRAFDPQEPFEHSSAGSEKRHAYFRAVRREDAAYRTGSASYRWAREAILAGRRATRRREAAKVRTPVLLFQAGQDTLVTPGPQMKFIRRVREGRLVLVSDSRHEIYRATNDVLGRYLTEIFRFFPLGQTQAGKK